MYAMCSKIEGNQALNFFVARNKFSEHGFGGGFGALIEKLWIGTCLRANEEVEHMNIALLMRC